MQTEQMPARPSSPDDLAELVGTELGPTEWFDITQELVNAFADVTFDHQWIHVDVERAATSSFGGTVAHGLLSLSLGPHMASQLLSFGGFAHALNYGYNKVRFPAPVPAGSRVRMRLTILEAEPVSRGIRVTTSQVFECERHDKPVLVAESVALVSP